MLGANESGKSSLLEFFRWLLFGSRGRALADPFPGEPKAGRLRFEDGAGELWTLERTGGEAGTLSGGPQGPRRPTLEEFLGNLDRRTFERVYGLGLEDLQGQEVLRPEEKGSASLTYGLGRLDLEAVLRQLQASARAELTARGSRARIPASQQRREELAAELRQAAALSQQYAQGVQELRGLEARAATHQPRREALGDRQRRVDRLLRALEPWRRWQATNEELRAWKEPAPPTTAMTEEVGDEISALIRRLEELRQTRQQLLREEDRLRQEEDRPLLSPSLPARKRDPASARGPRWLAWLPAAVLALIAVPFGLGLLPSKVFLAAALPLLLLALGLGWLRRWSAVAPRRANPAEAPPSAAPAGSKQEIRGALLSLDDELRETEAHLARHTSGLPWPTAMQPEHDLERRSQLRAQAARNRGALDALLAGDEDLERELATATAEPLEAEARQLAQQWEDLEQEAAESRQHKGRLEAQLESLEGREDAAALRLERQMVEERIRRGARRWMKAVLSRELLLRARTEFHRQRLPRILRRASRLLTTLTGEALELHPGEEGQLEVVDSRLRHRQAAAWSDGLGDQVYLSLRLSLADELDPAIGSLPLVLDDLLVRFDPTRQERALRVLLELSARRQIFLFSSHPTLQRQLARLTAASPPKRPWGTLELSRGRLRRVFFPDDRGSV